MTMTLSYLMFIYTLFLQKEIERRDKYALSF